MKLFKRTQKIIIKLDDFREEKLEDFIADSILKKLDENATVDKLEKQAIITGITAANAYMTTYGVGTLPEDVKEKIANETVKALGKANKLLQKQLKKKSAAYVKRHSEAASN